jgi:hypothetical protein
MKSLISGVLCFLLSVSHVSAVDYTQAGNDWVGQCDEGKKQSPILITDSVDVDDDNAFPVKFNFSTTTPFVDPLEQFDTNVYYYF